MAVANSPLLRELTSVQPNEDQHEPMDVETNVEPIGGNNLTKREKRREKLKERRMAIKEERLSTEKEMKKIANELVDKTNQCFDLAKRLLNALGLDAELNVC